MSQHASEQPGTRCSLCTNPVERPGDICPHCEPRYLDLGRALLAYERPLSPILAASVHRHITAPLRFSPLIRYYLKELDEPIAHGDQMVTHMLSVLSSTSSGSVQRDCWYGHNIPSALMAATINRDETKMGFPEEPDYFVPFSSWKPVPYPDDPRTTEGGRNDHS